MRRLERRGVVIGVALVLGMSVPATANGPAITEVVSGLDQPRGVAIGSDGTIYVAESGAGGSGPCVPHPELVELCFGATGAITAITDGAASELVGGLTSAVTPEAEAVGPTAVTVDPDGNVWFLVGNPGAGAAEFRDAVPDGAAAGAGQLYRVDENGAAQSVADLAAYETANNPDADQPGNAEPDSNAFGLAATEAGALVADAGGNDLLMVDGEGAITTVAVFPVSMQPAPPDPAAEPDPDAEPAIVPMDPVPTSVTVGPDGAYYVGQLTGFPFPPGGASVFRVAPGEEPTVYASGFTNIIDVEFAADGSLYVLEISHEGLLTTLGGGSAAGGLWKVPSGGGTPELIASDGLVLPGGMAVADDGTLYISTCTICPAEGGPMGAGSLVSLQP